MTVYGLVLKLTQELDEIYGQLPRCQQTSGTQKLLDEAVAWLDNAEWGKHCAGGEYMEDWNASGCIG